jgi:RHS repeat-associated protein
MNYRYTALGELAKDTIGGLDTIIWNNIGELWKIKKHNGDSIIFDYNGLGYRIIKEFKPLSGNPVNTYYINDLVGNILAIYTKTLATLPTPMVCFNLTEREVYGKERLGSENTCVQLIGAVPLSVIDTFSRYLGLKHYELDNTVGNVLAVVSDRKIPRPNSTLTNIDHYEADLLSANDYYSFGMLEPGRKFQSSSYKFGFNDKLKDDEVYGSGNELDFGKRIYDPRLGRFMTLDPDQKTYPWQSPFAYTRNNPILFIDFQGQGDPLAKMKIRRNQAINSFGIVRKWPDGSPKPHQGFDLAAPEHTKVLAVKDATVYAIQTNPDDPSTYGKSITLEIHHTDGTSTFAFYAHLSEINVVKGQSVKEGDAIGQTGTTGNAKGLTGDEQHLHFEYRSNPDNEGGLDGKLSPNDVLDTKFYSQDPDKKADVTVGVYKVDKKGNLHKEDPTAKGGGKSTIVNVAPPPPVAQGLQGAPGQVAPNPGERKEAPVGYFPGGGNGESVTLPQTPAATQPAALPGVYPTAIK